MLMLSMLMIIIIIIITTIIIINAKGNGKEVVTAPLYRDTGVLISP